MVFGACIGCNSNNSATNPSSAEMVKDAKRRAIDSVMNASDRPDSEQDSTSPAEERKKLAKTCNDVSIIDSTFISNQDTLHFHLKYYCLKDQKITVPKTYASDMKNPRDYTTYAFASDILLVRNKDTVLMKQFKASDFYPFFEDNFGGNLKKYGSILMPELARERKDKSKIILGYSISIPATDIGIGLSLEILNNGKYKVVKNF